MGLFFLYFLTKDAIIFSKVYSNLRRITMKRKMVISVIATLILGGCGQASTAEATDTTAVAETTVEETTEKETEPENKIDYLKIVDNSVTLDYVLGDNVGFKFVILIENTSETLIFDLPTVAATQYREDGTVLTAIDASEFYILPGDTIPLVEDFTIPRSEIDNAGEMSFTLSASDADGIFGSDKPRTTDLVTGNFSQREDGLGQCITGEVENTSDISASSLKMVLILRKDGKIVFADYAFLMNPLSPGEKQGFEVNSGMNGFPEYDTIEAYAIAS